MDLDYHFSEWAFLAQTDPAAFERRRRAYIEQFLRTSGHRRPYLEALQATIDAECELAGSPREAMLAVCRMMCHSLAELHVAMTTLSGEFKTLRRLAAVAQPAPQMSSPAAAGRARQPAGAPPVVIRRRGPRRLSL